MHTVIKSLGSILSILSIFHSDDYERFVSKESATAQAMKELERRYHSQMEIISRKHPILKNVKVGEYGNNSTGRKMNSSFYAFWGLISFNF